MNKKRKVAIIGTVGIPARYGGFETLAEHLVKNLGDRYDFTVYCSKKKYQKGNRPATYNGARLRYLPFNANGIQSIVYDSVSTLQALWYADVLLILGVAGCWMLPFVRLFTRKKIIVSIDGIEWKRDKWNRLAKWYLWWAEKMAVKFSHADIADNESIQDYTAVRYGSLSQIIEYGANHTLQVRATANDRELYSFLGSPYAFKVCRIEPENNIHLVLDAFAQLPKYTLVLVGNWNNSDYGQQLRSKYQHLAHLHLLDPIYDQRTLDLLRGNAHLYIHGHSAGGTNPSLVEAMFLGLPILTFDVSYNRTTTEGKAAYFRTADDIIQFVTQTRHSMLRACAERMKEIANRRYSWDVIARKYAFLVDAVLKSRKKLPVFPSITEFSDNTLLQLELGHLQTIAPFYEKRR